MKKYIIIILLFVLVSCGIKKEFNSGNYTIKENNLLMNHSIYDRDGNALFENVDLIYSVFDNGNYVLCNGLKFIKNGKIINDEVIKNEDKIINTVGGPKPYDTEEAKDCIIYNGKKIIDSMKNVLIYSYNISENQNDLLRMREFNEFMKKYK